MTLMVSLSANFGRLPKERPDNRCYYIRYTRLSRASLWLWLWVLSMHNSMKIDAFHPFAMRPEGGVNNVGR